MTRRYVGIQQANAMLPELRSRFALLFQLHLHVKNLMGELDARDAAPNSDSFAIITDDADEDIIMLRGQLRVVIDLIRDELDIIHDAGGIVRDIEQAGVSWYAKHPTHGDILLSWKLGEDEVTHWFEVGTGNPRRHTLEELGAAFLTRRTPTKKADGGSSS